MAERLIKDIDKYHGFLKYYTDKKIPFKTEVSGSTRKLIVGDRVYRYVDIEQSKGRGYHISKMVKKDIDAYFATNPVIPYQKQYIEQFYDLQAIENSIGKLSTAIDITNCYWKTLSCNFVIYLTIKKKQSNYI